MRTVTMFTISVGKGNGVEAINVGAESVEEAIRIVRELRGYVRIFFVQDKGTQLVVEGS